MSCAVCGTSTYRRLYDLPDGPIVECDHCGLVRREGLVVGEAAQQLYDDDDYLESPFFEALKVGADTQVEPYLVYRRVLEDLEDAVGVSSLLDVGCSYGAFMDLARSRGWEVRGVELSERSSTYAATERSLDVFRGTLEEASYPARSFSAVTLWDVIEHLDRPLDTVREIARVLRPGGVLFVFTVNQRSLINRVGHMLYVLSARMVRKPLSLLYDVHHNFFFSPETMRDLLERAGMSAGVRIEGADANIARWQSVPIPRLLAFGSDSLDAMARVAGQRYRMLVYAKKSEVGADQR